MDSRLNKRSGSIFISEITNNLQRFIVPEILCVIATILLVLFMFALFNSTHGISTLELLWRLFSCLAAGICWSTAGCLFSEAVLSGRKKLFVSSTSALFASGLSFWINRNYCWIGLCISALFLCTYLCSFKGNHKQKIEQFLFALLVTVVIFLTLITTTLLLFSLMRGPLEQHILQHIVMPFFLAPASLFSPIIMLGLMPKPDSVIINGKTPLRFVLSWIVLPVYLCLVFVFIVYIVIVIIKWELPIWQINPFAIALLVMFAILNLVLDGDENKIAEWFLKWGAWPLVPIIASQTVVASIRINAFGLTAWRILGIILSGICLIQFVFGVLRKRTVIVPLIAAVLTLVLTATPLNAWNLAQRAQDIRLYNALIKAEMIDSNGNVVPNPNATEEDIENIRSAFAMLSNDSDLQPDTQAYRIIQRIRRYYAPYPISYEIVLGFPYIPSKNTGLLTILLPDDAGYSNRQYEHPTFKVYRYASVDEVDGAGFSDAKYVKTTLHKTNNYLSSIEGYVISLDRISEIIDFSKPELDNGDILMEDGTVFRICMIVEEMISSQPVYYCMFWMLMP